MDEYGMKNNDWRKDVGKEKVLLDCGLVVEEREVYLAIEKLTPLLQRREGRYPNEEDIVIFVLILRGP